MRTQTTQLKRQKNSENHMTKASEGNLGTRTLISSMQENDRGIEI